MIKTQIKNCCKLVIFVGQFHFSSPKQELFSLLILTLFLQKNTHIDVHLTVFQEFAVNFGALLKHLNRSIVLTLLL